MSNESYLALPITPEEIEIIESACGLLTTEAFIRQAAVAAAKQLIAISTPEERRGSVPVFNYVA